MLIVDGSSLASRAYYSGGYPGFCNMMLRIKEDYATDDEVFFVFDGDEENFRKSIYTDYKKHRVDDGRKDFIRKLYETMKLHDYAVATASEGDDAILYLVNHADLPYVVTGDKDLFALVNDCILVWYGKEFKDRGVVTEQTVLETFGVNSWLLADFKGLVGDASDGIPGVKGIGQKGAVELIKSYGSGDLIFEDPPTTGRYKFLATEEAKKQYYLSKRLATIVEEEVHFTGFDFKPFGKLLKDLLK